MNAARRFPRPPETERGFSVLELTVALGLIAVLTPALLGAAGRLRTDFYLDFAREEAARVIAEARWAAVRTGSAVVELTAMPPRALAVAATGDTVASADLGTGGVGVSLSRGRPSGRLRFGAMGLGFVSSQTVVFSLGGQRRTLVVSAHGRVARR